MLTFANLVAICAGVAAIIGLGELLRRMSIGLWRGARRLNQVIDDLLGETKRPELPEELRRLGVIELVRKMAPELKRLATNQDELVGQVRQLAERVDVIESRQRAPLVLTPSIPTQDAQRVEVGSTLLAERASEDPDGAVRVRYGFR